MRRGGHQWCGDQTSAASTPQTIDPERPMMFCPPMEVCRPGKNRVLGWTRDAELPNGEMSGPKPTAPQARIDHTPATAPTPCSDAYL